MRTFNRAGALAALVLITGIATTQAASLPASASRDALVHAKHLQRLSVGAGVEHFDRQIELKNGSSAQLQGDTYLGYIGIDLTDWLTLFGEAGMSDVSGIENYISGAVGDDTYGAAGLLLNLWKYEVLEPEAMAGLLNIRLLWQNSLYGGSGNGVATDWREQVLALPVSYEVRADPVDDNRTVYSAVFSAGPIYSAINGDVTTGSGNTIDFNEKSNLGIYGALDVFIFKNVSIGGQIHVFEDMTYALRGLFHF